MRLAALPIGLGLSLACALALAGEPPGSTEPAAPTTPGAIPTPEPAPAPEPAVDPNFDVTGISEYNLPPAPIQGCQAELQAAGAIFKDSPLGMRWNRSKEFLCGAKQVVRYTKGPSKIRYSSSPRVTCSVARALLRLETIVQEEAERLFGKRVIAMQQMGTYNCREIAAYAGWVSQHSFANAIDIKNFTLKGGKTITVQKSYGRGPDTPKSKEGQFLRAVVRRVVDEGVFTVVLTPNFNRAHHNHFHFDLASYTVDGT
jgi:hypothetical protein